MPPSGCKPLTHVRRSTGPRVEVPVKHRGRPKAGAPVESHRVYTVTFDVTAPRPEQIQAEQERRSTLILLTSKMTLDARTALQEYTAQDHNEHRFRWTKSPLHLEAFWLEKPQRVTGLGYALLLALQFARFMRALVRAAPGLAGTAAGSEAIRNGDLGRVGPRRYQTNGMGLRRGISGVPRCRTNDGS